MKNILETYIKGKSQGFNRILVDRQPEGRQLELTEKGLQVLNTWLKIAKCHNNEAVITLPDGRVFNVTDYAVVEGPVYDLINFSPEVTMTKEAQAARKWVVKEEDVTVDDAMLVSPALLNDILTEWQQADSSLKLTLKAISKERKVISDFKFLYNGAGTYLVVGSPAQGGVNENVIFFRKVQFKSESFKGYYTTYTHYIAEEERKSWILGRD